MTTNILPSSRIMSVYERTSMVGARLSQLAHGAKSTLSEDELYSCKDIREIAEKELRNKKMPLMLKRILPNNEIEFWKLDDLIIV